MISEIRTDRMGIMWMTSKEDTTTVIHSVKSGVLLRVSALDEWTRRSQKLDFKERTTGIQIGNLNLTAVYQPVNTHGEMAIDTSRKENGGPACKSAARETVANRRDNNSQICKSRRGQEQQGNGASKLPPMSKDRD